jgi:hypothetical protein
VVEPLPELRSRRPVDVPHPEQADVEGVHLARVQPAVERGAPTGGGRVAAVVAVVAVVPQNPRTGFPHRFAVFCENTRTGQLLDTFFPP